MQLKQYLKVIRKRWWLAVLVSLAAASIAFLYSAVQPKIYETEVTVVGTTAKPDTGLDNSVKSELHRLQSTIPTSNTAARLNQRGAFDLSPDQILGKLKVQTKPDEYILKITVDDTDPKNAAKIANTLADLIQDQYIEQESTTPDDSKIFFSKIAPAAVPDRPSQPRTLLNTGAAALLGLVLGLILIFVVEYFDNSIHTEEDVALFTGLNVLGSLPSWQPGRRSTTLPNSKGLSGTAGFGHSADASTDSLRPTEPKPANDLKNANDLKKNQSIQGD